MDKHRKAVPRYFNANKSIGGGGGAATPKSKSPFKGKNKFDKNKKRKQSAGSEEVIDVDATEGGTEVDIDPNEISAFVNKLGLNKFANLGQLSTSPSPKVQKDRKAAKKIVKPLNVPKPENKKIDNTATSKHIKFSDDEETAIPDSSKFPKNKKQNQNGKLTSKKQKGKKGKVSNDAKPSATKLIVKPDGNKWFQESEDIKDSSIANPIALRQEEVTQIHSNANNLLDADILAYKAANFTGSNKSDYQWMDKMMKTGTLPDRMAAFIVRIQDSPVHNLHYLQQLISMVKVQGKQQCMMTADTVRDLFLEDLLPPDRKLVTFSSRGAQLRTAAKKQLIKWTFEDRLKVLYSSYVEALRRMAADTVEKLRGKGISIVYQMLVSHPEQEEVLLQILVNKLGDPAKKMASRALFYLKQLMDEHPRMKRVVVEEVERLLFRNNISKRAQYYGICFLNMVNLKDEHPSLAHKLITVYVAFFKSSVKTGDIDTKMMSGLLTGINRAFPQAQEFGFQFTENLDTLYKIVQFSQFSISIQALCILFQIVNVVGNPAGADRFYRVLYEKLNAPEFKMSSHNGQLLNLIFRALKADVNINRVSGFTKRLLQVCQNSTANLACAILLLLSEVAKVHPQCLNIGNRSEKELETQNNELRETTDSEDSEDDEERKKSMVTNSAALEKLMKSTNIRISDESSSSLKSEAKLTPTPMEILKNSCQTKDKTGGPTIVSLDEEVKSEDSKTNLKRILTEYDPYARNPSYCGAELSLSFELISLCKHFHPSVALFAQTLIKGKSIKYDGNPFRDFTLTRFLERFSYRNAKPSKHHAEYQPKGLRNVPVNSDNYLSTEEEQIPIEEKFFYRFFKTKTVETKDKEQDEDVSDAESIGDDEFDDLMKNYFKSGKDQESDDDLSSDEAGPVDFASGLSTTKVGSKKRKHQESASEDEEEDDEEESGSDMDVDDFISLDDDNTGDLDEDDGLESGNDDDDLGIFEDDDETVSFMPKRKSKKSLKGDDMFAPAEEFAEMLEENADEIMTGSQTLINREKADKKQLKWEVDRDRWVKGYAGTKRGNNKRKKFKKS